MAAAQGSKTKASAAPAPDLSRWFGEPEVRRPTVAPERIESLRVSPAKAAPLPRSVAWFAAHVMLHGGVFSGLQVERWLARHDHRWPSAKSERAQHSYRQRFVQPFFTPRYSSRPIAATLQCHGGATFAHILSKPAYAALGVSDSRFRRTAEMALVMQRLLAYDFIVERSDLGWIGEPSVKLEFFDALGVSRDALPFRTYRASGVPAGAGGARDRGAPDAPAVPLERVAWFPDNVPIGYGPWQVVFVMPCRLESFTSVVSRIREYERLWRALRSLGVRVSVAFVVRASEKIEGLDPLLSGFAQGPDRVDRERLLLQVERYVLESAPASILGFLDRLYQVAGSSRAQRMRHLEEALRAENVVKNPREKPGAMDVSCFLSQRLSASRWDLAEPTAVQMSR